LIPRRRRLPELPFSCKAEGLARLLELPLGDTIALPHPGQHPHDEVNAMRGEEFEGGGIDSWFLGTK
jgi:hypothetical protein